MNINITVIDGRLTSDAGLKYTASGKAISKFSIACNGFKGQDGKEAVDYFECALWGKYAESIAQYLIKGKEVTVSGRLKQNRWKSDDGKSLSKIVINVENVRIHGGKKKEDGNESDNSTDDTGRGIDDQDDYGSNF